MEPTTMTQMSEKKATYKGFQPISESSSPSRNSKPTTNTTLEREKSSTLVTQPETELEAKPETELEAKPETELEAKPETELEAKPETELEAKPVFDAEEANTFDTKEFINEIKKSESGSEALSSIAFSVVALEKANQAIALAEKTKKENQNKFRTEGLNLLKDKAEEIYNHFEKTFPKQKKGIEARIKQLYILKIFSSIEESSDEIILFAKAVLFSFTLTWNANDWDLFIETTKQWPTKSTLALFPKFKTKELFVLALKHFKELGIIPEVKELENYRQSVAPTKILPEEKISEPTISLILARCQGKKGKNSVLNRKEIEQHIIDIRTEKIEQLKKEGEYSDQTQIPITNKELIAKIENIATKKDVEKVLKLVPKPRESETAKLKKENQELKIQLQKERVKVEELSQALGNLRQDIQKENKETREDIIEILIEFGTVPSEKKENILNALEKRKQKRQKPTPAAA